MNKYVLLLLFILSSIKGYTQKEAFNWYFGARAGINFNSSPPQALFDSKLNTFEGCASISDGNGNLLFYTDGSTVWDKTHDVMQNGTGLFGHSSTTQSAVIIKAINVDNIYYIFTNDALDGYANNTHRGFNYTVVDMSLNSGRGVVVSKNNLLATGTSEKIAAVSHANDVDFWVVTSKNEKNEYLAFKITANGVDATPVTSNVGMLHDDGRSSSAGCMKMSLDGKYLGAILRGNGVELFDFDNSTGKLSNARQLEINTTNYYGIEFSPDSRRLYVSIDTYNQGKIYQYDVSSGNINAIRASKYMVSDVDIYGALQLGPDGEIYCSWFGQQSLSVIHKPDELGAACDFERGAISIAPYACRGGLPPYFSNYLLPERITVNQTCYNDTTLFSIINIKQVDSVVWNFGEPSSGNNNVAYDTSVYHIYSAPGTYNVSVIRWSNGIGDTTETDVEIYLQPQFSLGLDTALCTGDTLFYDFSSLMPVTYSWSTGKTGANDTITEAGQYVLSISENNCWAHDTVNVTIDTFFKYYLPNDTFVCEEDSLILDIGLGADSYNWSTGSTTKEAVFKQQDTYTVTTTSGVCEQTDTVFIEVKSLPRFELGSDSIICSTDSITLTGNSNVKHEWNIGDTNQSITVKTADTYILKQSNEFCSYSDTIIISTQQPPAFNIGSDTVLCVGERVIIGNAVPNGVSYTWSHAGSTTPKVVVSQQDDYSVIAYDGVCRAYDTVFVGIYTPQSIELGADSTLCEGTETELDATITRGQYLWSDGVQTPDRTINTTGTYDVQVIDSVCSYADTITLTFNPVPPLNLGPDTVLCQEEVHQVSVNSGWDEVSWSDGSNNFSRVFTTEGIYRVTAGYLNCEELDTLQIGYHPLLPDLDLGEDKDVCDPLFYVLESSYSGYYATQWQDGTKGNYYEVTQTGDYIISTLPHRCGQVSDTIHITFLRELCDLHIPNAFSPNGDGDNDYFFPVGYQMDVESMKIYSRWGELLYDGNQPWDGTYQGAKLPNGAYLYIITYKKEHRGAKKRMLTKGTVQILR